MSRTMDTTSSFEPKVLMSKGKRATAAYIHADCSNNRNPQHLNEVLDNLLNPQKAIDEWETIDWCKWLMAGGRTPDEFASTVRAYDNATTCGLVWTPNFVAYRCRTCGISPCMSLCTECFKKGNHFRHDFNMFLSQAGGACDCGDTSVMKEAGFCDRHGPNKGQGKANAPANLMCVGEAMMPRIILRLVQHLRENSRVGTADSYKIAIQEADAYISMLLDFNNMGGLMRKVITSALTNPQKYQMLNEVPEELDNEYAQYQFESRRLYEEALRSMPNPEPADEFRDYPSLQVHLVHRTFLEELVFWNVKFEFPQKVVCLLLNMLPDPDYKEPLTRALILHYTRIAMVLETSSDPDTLSNRVVHVSVQLFSNESLALRMAEQLNLLQVMVISLKYMMNKIMIKNMLHDVEGTYHYVVDCAKSVMKEHCYWPLVSDLNNVLSHRPVTVKFLTDEGLLEMWFSFLNMFQGMNFNEHELNLHVEFEPNTYYAAFSAELEASAYPMWAMLSHLTDESTAYLSRRVLGVCVNELRNWFAAIAFNNPMTAFHNDNGQVSFHLPLHRYLATFIFQAVTKQNVKIKEILPSNDNFVHLLMMHPLRVQVVFYEILNCYWLRNGLQIKGQAMTYIQCNFCNSMVDADIFLLQVCSSILPGNTFFNTVMDKFHVKEWTSMVAYQGPQYAYLAGERDTPMLPSFLTFITSLICIRTGLGLTETDVNRLEMLTLLCMSDKTHSQLMDLMPERSGVSQSRDFESVLTDVADYRPMALEASGNMKQGMYSPKAVVWNERYDPIHVLLRAVHRKDFQTSMDRYTTYAQKTGKIKADMNPWPPYRTPADVHEGFDDPRQILRCRVFHALAFIALYKTLKGHLTEHAAPMIVFLLEQAVLISNKDKDTKMCSANPSSQSLPTDMDLETWYPEDSLYDNLKTVIGRVVLTPEPEVSTIAYSSDSDLDWDNSETDNDLAQTTMLLLGDGGGGVANWTADGEQSASREMMVFRGTPNDVEMPNSPLVETPPSGTLALPSMSMEVDDETSVAFADNNTETPSPTEVPALPPPVVRPALTAGNEVGRTVMATSNRELVPTSSQGHRKPTSSRRKQTVTGTNTYYPPTVKINESLISLLLKLHSQYTGRPDSFTGEHDCEPSNPSVKYDTVSHFGDGAYYIGRLLTKISEADSSCKKFIQETRRKLWPTKQEVKPPCETEDKEERRRRAKERQEKLMREFAERQKEFMQRTMETNEEDQEESVEAEEVEEERMVKQQEYHCVICNRETPSTEDHPMGLIILVQSTGVVGHKKKYGSQEVKNLPLSDDDKDLLLEEDTLSAEYEKRLDVLSRYFDPKSWFLSVNIGWDSGVHVITCGHHLHLDCLHMYMVTLIAQAQRHQNLQPEKGEYFCPLCRQISNSALPLLPQLGDKTSMVRSRSNESMSEVLDELSHFLRENDQSPSSSKMAEAIGKVMDDMSSMTRLEGTFKPRTDNTMAQSLFLFVTSIARTNLEVEMLLRGGSLVMPESVNPLLPRRECMVPLLHVLAVHARVTRELSMWPSWMTFQQLCGLQPPVTITTVAPVEREVPLLLRDPIALLLQFVLLLPLHLDQTYFTTTVQMVYNLLYYQVVAQISCGLSNAERMKATTTGSSLGQIKHLSDALGLINERLGQTELYGEDDMPGVSDDRPQVNILALEQQVQKLLLPYLRIASLLKFHLYQQPLPEIRSQQSEFVRLVYYLELVTESMDWGCFNAAVALNWPAETTMAVDSPRSWTEQLAVHVARNQFVVRGLLREQHALWITPRLLQLPREYEKIFSYYHEKPCKRCQSVAAETSICLLCGTIVCLKQNCCKRHNVCEAVTHAAECGAGTGVFLVVTSTYIIVIRGPRACLWGSLYLDDFEEEDRDLKRGKPLYLSKVRFQLLEQQWLSHRFNHTRRSWVLHRNAL